MGGKRDKKAAALAARRAAAARAEAGGIGGNALRLYVPSRRTSTRAPKPRRRPANTTAVQWTEADYEAMSVSHRVLLDPNLCGLVCSRLPLHTLFAARASTRLCSLVNEVLLGSIATLRKTLDSPPVRISLPALEDTVSQYVNTQYLYGGAQLVCWQMSGCVSTMESRYASHHLIDDVLRNWPVLDSWRAPIKLKVCEAEEFEEQEAFIGWSGSQEGLGQVLTQIYEGCTSSDLVYFRCDVKDHGPVPMPDYTDFASAWWNLQTGRLFFLFGCTD